MDWLTGFILVGGKSSRMGTDKARLQLGDCSFTERIAATLSTVTSSVGVVGGSAHNHPGLKSTPDVFTAWGALGGIHAALANCHTEWTMVVACDLPFVTPDLLKRLIQMRSGFEAVAPLQPNGYLQPLCALYRVEPCLGRAEQLINSGERRPLALLDLVKTRVVQFEELSDLTDADHFFDNINTPDDYLKAKAKGGNRPAKG